jgi:hypothetical protein
MSQSTPGELARQVRTIPGVTNVFAPRPSIDQLPSVIAAATASDADGPVADILVTTDRDDVTTVSTRIATSVDDSSVDTARRVADVLLAHTPDSARVQLQIARIR